MSVWSFSTGCRPWFSIMMITNGAGAARALGACRTAMLRAAGPVRAAGATGAARTTPPEAAVAVAGTAAPSAVSNAAAAAIVPASLARDLFIWLHPLHLILPVIGRGPPQAVGIRLSRVRVSEDAARRRESHHSDERLREQPPWQRARLPPGRARTHLHRARRARAGRVLPGPADRAAGDHRHLLHRARPVPRRHALLPLPVGGRRPGRRAEPVPRDGIQERAGQPRPRWRQGGDHRGPGPAEDRGPA